MDRQDTAGSAMPPRFSSAVVLDVDAIVALDMAETLAELGIAEVAVVHSAAALSQAAAAHRFDLAVLDAVHGAELAGALARAGTAIIALGMPPDGTGWGAGSGGVVMVAKPYHRRQIAAAVYRISAAAPSGRPPRP